MHCKPAEWVCSLGLQTWTLVAGIVRLSTQHVTVTHLGTRGYDWGVTSHPVTVDLNGREQTLVGDHTDQSLQTLLLSFLTASTYTDRHVNNCLQVRTRTIMSKIGALFDAALLIVNMS